MGCYLAVLVDLELDGSTTAISLSFTIRVTNSAGEQIAMLGGDIAGEFNGPPELDTPTYLPIAFPLEYGLPAGGVYDLEFRVEGVEPTTLRFKANVSGPS